MSDITHLLAETAAIIEGDWAPVTDPEAGAYDLFDAMWAANHGPNGLWALATTSPDVIREIACSGLCCAALRAISIETGYTPLHSGEALARVRVWQSWPGRTHDDILDVLVAAMNRSLEIA